MGFDPPAEASLPITVSRAGAEGATDAFDARRGSFAHVRTPEIPSRAATSRTLRWAGRNWCSDEVVVDTLTRPWLSLSMDDWRVDLGTWLGPAAPEHNLPKDVPLGEPTVSLGRLG